MSSILWSNTNEVADEIHDLFSKSGVYRNYDVVLKSIKKEYGSLFICKVRHENRGYSVFKFAFKVNHHDKIQILLNICKGFVASLK